MFHALQIGLGPVENFFETMPSAPSRQALLEDGWAILGNVLVQQDAGLGIAEQSRQPPLRSRNGRWRRSSPSCSITSEA